MYSRGFRKIIAIITAVCMVIGMWAVTGPPITAWADGPSGGGSDSGGEGPPWEQNEPGSPYLISDDTDLIALCNPEYSEYWGYDFLQTDDIDLEEILESVDWMPIGEDGKPFTGTYDGGNFTISNLTIHSDELDSLGLFGYVQGGTLQNINLANASVTSTLGEWEYAGGLAGLLSGAVSNCSVDGQISGGAGAEMGGLVGMLSGSESIVTDSSMSGSVTGADDVYCVGGLVGFSYGTIQYSSSTADIFAGARIENGVYAGGLAGISDTVAGCYSTGNVTVGNNTSEYSSIYAGGLAGQIKEVEESYASGNVTAGYNAGTAESANVYAGGLAGCAEEVWRCSSEGNVTAGDNTGAGSVFAGGLCGEVITSVTESYSISDITAGDNSGTDEISSVAAGGLAGIIGFGGSSLITDSYSKGSVSVGDETAEGGEAYALAGGLIGMCGGIEIVNCYSAGAVTGGSGATTDGLARDLTGGLTVTSCYYDSVAAGTVDPGGEGAPKTPAQMMMEGTYVGWDFENVWRLSVSESDYPILIWQSPLTEGEMVENAAAALTWDVIRGANLAPDYVTSDLTLPSSGRFGTMIEWSSDDTDTIAISGTDGFVTRPASGEGDAAVTLTATVTMEGSAAQEEVVFALTVPAELTWAPVDGTYQVSSLEHLYELMANDEYWDDDFLQTADIDIPDAPAGGSNWSPIGDDGTPFSGTYDGGGKRIANLTVNNDTLEHVGMFGYVDGGALANLTLENAAVSGSADWVAVGALAGRAAGGTVVDDCVLTGSSAVSAAGDDPASYPDVFAGGLVGYVGETAAVRDCDVTVGAEITGEDGNTVYAGGLIGCDDGGIVEGCSVAEGVTVIGGAQSSLDLGGLIGRNDGGTVVGCTGAAAVVAVEDWSSKNVGGLIGYNYNGTVTNCGAAAVITAEDESSKNVGGLIGLSEGTSTVAGCYSTAGEISGNNGTVVGGLVGCNDAEIAESYSIGVVSAGNWAHAGGLAGKNYGNVRDSYSFGAVSAGDGAWAGGLAGRQDSGGVIDNCYSVGSVDGGAGSSVGGLVGVLNSGSVTDSYYDSGIAGLNDTEKGIPKTTAEMMAFHTFDEGGWDFSDSPGVWTMEEMDGDGYPWLKWQGLSSPTADAKTAMAASLITWSAIRGDNRAPDKVAADLAIPGTGIYGVPIVWSAIPGGFIDTEPDGGIGAVTRPAAAAPAQPVALSATIGEGGAARTKAFNLAILAGPAWTGSGAENDAYQVSSPAHLDDVRNLMGPGVYFIQTADIDLSAAGYTNWTPIGDDENEAAFAGVYDGDGHSILNLAIENGTLWDVGLFSSVGAQGTLKNITLENAEVLCTKSEGASVGALVGYNEGEIINCLSTGSAVTGADDAYAGGIVGANYGGSLTGCENSGTVSGGDGAILGGVVGWNSDGDIASCVNTGEITGAAVSGAGGIAGYYGGGSVTDCTSTGWISATGTWVDGLVGSCNIELLSVSLDASSARTEYMVGEALDVSGLLAVGQYADNNTAVLPLTIAAGDVGGFDSSAVDPDLELTVAMEYRSTEYTDTYTVSINPFVWGEGQDGSAEHPYEVSSAAHLNAVRSDLDAHYIQTAPINLAGINWTPIGTNYPASAQFTGVYDGNGYTISNLTIDSDSLVYAGLFGYVGSNGSILDVTLEGVDIDVSRDSDLWAGALTGFNAGSISGSGSTGSIVYSGGAPYYTVSIGGLAGYNSGTVENSHSACGIEAASNIRISVFAGGLVGSNGGVIRGSCGAGDVDVTLTNAHQYVYAGGLAGATSGDASLIENSFSTGDVTATVTPAGESYAYAGGLVGSKYGNIANTYSTGSVTAGGTVQAGGLIGLIGLDGFGSLTASYYLETAAAASDGGEPLSAAELKQQAKFTGWDFDTVWKIGEGITSPTLRWQPWTPDEQITADRSALAWNDIKGENSAAENVTQTLTLPAAGTNGTTITWTADPAGYINTSTGAVTRPANEDKAVTLSAIVSKTGGTAQTKAFGLTIIGVPYYSVTYHANGGTGTAPTETDKPAGAAFTAAANSFSAPAGKQFKEWNMASDGTGTAYAAGADVTMPADALSLYAVWENIPSGGDNNGGGGGSGGTPPPPQDTGGNITAQPTLNRTTGLAGAAIDNAALNAALEKTVASGGIKTVGIEIPKVEGASGYEATLPAGVLTGSGPNTRLEIKTDIADVTLPGNMIPQGGAAGASNVSLAVAQADISTFDEELKNQIGSRPVIQLTLSIDGEQTDWSNPNAPVTVSIPYTPTAAELANPESIVVWYIDGNGNAVSVPNGRYDPATGTVIFDVTHFSDYAVVYNQVSFGDVPAGAWYSKAVGFIAARDITTGTGGGNFSPNAKLTRGQFLVMLMKAYEIAPDKNTTNNFSDAGSTYYTGYLAAAKRLGISGGVGDNMFAPERQITRQEMFTLLYNALKVINRLPQGDSGKPLSNFSDADQIASWAADAMTFLVEAGTVSGSNGALTPLSTTTRAEMAQALYNLLAK